MIWSLAALESLPVPVVVAALGLIGVGFSVGVISAAFGIGGGFVITPLCHALLGMPAPLAVATSMGQIPLLSFSGVWRYWQSGHIAWRLAAYLLIGALPAAQLVAGLLSASSDAAWPVIVAGQTLPDLVLLTAFTLCIGGLGCYNLVAGRSQHKVWGAKRRLGPVALIASGAVFGGVSALLGIGGGFFAVPLFTYFCGLSPIQAVATSLFAVLVTSALTTVHYLWLGQIYFAISLIIALGSMVGARVGASMAMRSSPGGLLKALGLAQLLISATYLGAKLSGL